MSQSYVQIEKLMNSKFYNAYKLVLNIITDIEKKKLFST